MRLWLVTVALAACAFAPPEDFSTAKSKLESIYSDQLHPGTVVLTSRELNDYIAHEAPPGVRNTRLVISRPGVATGSALVDFGKVERAQGHPPGWLMSKILDGERPVSLTARIASSKGRATIQVESVQVSGVTVDGTILGFLIENLLLPKCPNLVINRPFDLGHHIDHVNVQPAAIDVVIGR
jgi:hypothetical protein